MTGRIAPSGRRSRRADETAAALRRDIKSGRFAEADVLPGERQLADLLEVSRTTLRRALAELTAEGLLAQRQGLGTTVNRVALDKEPVGQTRTTTLKTNGIFGERPDGREFERGFTGPTVDEAMLLAVPPGEAVFRVSRVIMADAAPVAVEHQAAPRRFLPNEPAAGQFVLDTLAEAGFRPAQRLRRLRSGQATLAEATALDVPPGTPTLSLHDALYLDGGQCCALVRTLYRADRMDVLFGADLPPGAGLPRA